MDQQKRFAIRKLTIGAVSVVIGTTTVFLGGHTAHADEVDDPQTTTENVVNSDDQINDGQPSANQTDYNQANDQDAVNDTVQNNSMIQIDPSMMGTQDDTQIDLRSDAENTDQLEMNKVVTTVDDNTEEKLDMVQTDLSGDDESVPPLTLIAPKHDVIKPIAYPKRVDEASIDGSVIKQEPEKQVEETNVFETAQTNAVKDVQNYQSSVKSVFKPDDTARHEDLPEAHQLTVFRLLPKKPYIERVYPKQNNLGNDLRQQNQIAEKVAQAIQLKINKLAEKWPIWSVEKSPVGYYLDQGKFSLTLPLMKNKPLQIISTGLEDFTFTYGKKAFYQFKVSQENGKIRLGVLQKHVELKHFIIDDYGQLCNVLDEFQ